MKSLSAIGSNILPKLLSRSIFLAKYPSKKSDAAIAINNSTA
ncbi:uncharacterized protein METZ01_LOCUS120423 [marine metagenome]|uniref:Uncharacterized protein n=1 Tax=marine metagenome TaxID=408172 RepID=A0A381XS31_9ZZZZ